MKSKYAILLQIIASVLPAAGILISSPVVRHRLTENAFAEFSVIVTITGLLSVLDGGLGKAGAFFSSQLSKRTGPGLNTLISKFIRIGLTWSVVAGLILCLAKSVLFDASASIQQDFLYVLILATPVFVVSSILRGMIEGRQGFSFLAISYCTHGLALGLLPIFIISSDSDLKYYIFWIVGLRLVLVATLWIAAHDWKGFYNGSQPPPTSSHILSYSKWLFASNLVGLMIVYADRMAAMYSLSGEQLASYLLPMEILSRAQVVVAAACTVYFPKIIARIADGHATYVHNISRDARIVILALHLTIAFAAMPFTPALMRAWLGQSVDNIAFLIVPLGLAGLALNSAATVSLTVINGSGHTKLVAWLHFAELVLYFIAILVAVRLHDPFWLLAAWLGRMFVDSVGMKLIQAFILGKRQAQSRSRRNREYICDFLIILLIATSLLHEHLERLQIILPLALAAASMCIAVQAARSIRGTIGQG